MEREGWGEVDFLSSMQFCKTSQWQKCWVSKSSLLAGLTASPLLNICHFHTPPDDSPSPIQLLSVMGREDQVPGFSGSPPCEEALPAEPPSQQQCQMS